MAIIVCIAAIFAIWKLFFNEVKVQGYKVQRQDAIKGVTVTGIIQSIHDIRVGSSVTAKIQDIRFKEGDFVRKGQILAILDKKEALGNLDFARGQLESAAAQVRNLQTEPRYQQVDVARAQVREARASINTLQQQLINSQIQLQNAQSEEQRFAVLYNQGAISFRDYEVSTFSRAQAQAAVAGGQTQIRAARARLAQAQGNLSLIQAGVKPEQIQSAQGQVRASQGSLEAARGRFDNYILRAPVTGYITTKLLDVGEVASSIAPVFRMVSQKSLYASTQVEENQLKTIKLGQDAYLIFDAYPNETFTGKVIEVLKDVNPATGTFIAKINVTGRKDHSKPNKCPQINRPVISGMTLDATIVTKEEKNILIIPSEFVFTKSKKLYVYKKVGDKSVKTYIQGELFDNNRFKVTHGLKPNDIIVKKKGRNQPKPDQRINIQEFYKG